MSDFVACITKVILDNKDKDKESVMTLKISGKYRKEVKAVSDYAGINVAVRILPMDMSDEILAANAGEE